MVANVLRNSAQFVRNRMLRKSSVSVVKSMVYRVSKLRSWDDGHLLFQGIS